jgi:hypothetical protein
MIIPTGATLLAMREYIASQGDLDKNTYFGFPGGVIMIVFYLFCVGVLHFNYTRKVFSQLPLTRDLRMRVLTWDLPCYLWIALSEFIYGIMFRSYDAEFMLLLCIMFCVCPFIVIGVATLTHIAMKRVAPAMSAEGRWSW